MADRSFAWHRRGAAALAVTRAIALVVTAGVALAACAPRKPQGAPLPGASRGGPVTLTLSSWRKDDVAQMDRILAAFNAKNPGIVVRHTPMESDDITLYSQALMAQLKYGQGPDLYYLPSYAMSRQFWNSGYLALLGDLPGLKENFKPETLAAWSTVDGRPYGVPFIATSHGVYYNVEAFGKLGIEIPATWDRLLAAAEAFKEAGYVPFANGSGEPWTMAEIVFMNMAPSFLGGRQGRMDYLAGKRPFNDAAMERLFRAIGELAPYVSPHQRELGYAESLQLFLRGTSPMWLGGSWDIPFFESQKPAFAWSVFAVPPPEGGQTAVTFHLDAGVGLNAASQHLGEARVFLSWLASPEAGALLGDELPGFFPMHIAHPDLAGPHAREFMRLNDLYPTDIRFAWERISEGSPSAYDLIMRGSIDVLNGDSSPRAAADRLQAGLASWYRPVAAGSP